MSKSWFFSPIKRLCNILVFMPLLQETSMATITKVVKIEILLQVERDQQNCNQNQKILLKDFCRINIG